MFRCARRLSSILLLLALLVVTAPPGFSSVPRAAAQAGSPTLPNYLALLATSQGSASTQLELVDRSPMTLPDGREVVRIKAIDRSTGQITGATFDGGKIVDEAALRAQVARQWRATHGALMPDMVDKLAALQPTDTLDVALWLRAGVQALPKVEHINAEAATPGASAGGPGEPIQAASPVAGSDKPVAVPLSFDQLPPEVRAAVESAGGEPATQAAQSAQPALLEKLVREPGLQTVPVAPEAASALAAIEAFKAQNDATIAGQISPVRSHFLDVLAARGLAGQVQYASKDAPVVYLSGVTRQQVEALAQLAEVDAIYDARMPGGPALSTARPTQNADLLETWGSYTGSGVNVAVVEGERMVTNNPYLTVAGVRDDTRSVKPHPSAVGGMVRSTHASVRGLAPGVTLYNSNGDDYATSAALATAMDWGSDNATVLNNSFWVEDQGTTDALQVFDRHMDYIVRYHYDTAVVAAGNFALTGCQYAGSPAANYVSTPGKGYNALTVGNYDDVNTLGWTDDAMDGCSSYNHSGRYKPEVAAVGHDLQSTTTASPWTGSVGSGTSYASPMVTALAADLIQVAPSLAVLPEAARAIIMASADHNIEGDARLSRLDGTGSIDAAAAAVVAERGDWDDRYIDSSTTFPITFNVFAWQGERVRFVSNWLSNPTADYTTDPAPVDLDLQVYRQDGTTLIQGSYNGPTPFEILDFVAPASETYVIKLSHFTGTFSGGTWLGSAWWRGPWRPAPNLGYTDPPATPMGTHIAYYPADHAGVNYWRAMGIRSPAGTDHDLELDSASWFADPSTRSEVNYSNLVGAVDFVAVDGNYRLSTPEFYRIYRYSGSGGANVTYSSPAIAMAAPGLYGPFTMTSAETVKVFDVYFSGLQGRQIWLVPTGSNLADLGATLEQSAAADPATWTRRHSQGVAEANASAAATAVEKLAFTNRSAGDWLGLVTYNNNGASAAFYVMIRDAFYVPFIQRP